MSNRDYRKTVGIPQRGQSTRPVICNTRRDKIYCGSKCYLPDDSYTRFGTSFECMMKGIQVGKLQKQNEDLLVLHQRVRSRSRSSQSRSPTRSRSRSVRSRSRSRTRTRSRSPRRRS